MRKPNTSLILAALGMNRPGTPLDELDGDELSRRLSDIEMRRISHMSRLGQKASKKAQQSHYEDWLRSEVRLLPVAQPASPEEVDAFVKKLQQPL